jgi:hypothetical protein
MFTGCAGISPSKLEPPAKALLQPSPKLPEVKAGDDLVAKHAELRRGYATETDKYRRLQKYVKTILK